MEKDFSMELKDIFILFKRKLWLICLITLVTTSGSFCISRYLITPVYEATATVIIGNSPRYIEEYKTEFYEYSDVLMYQQLAATYGEIAESRSIAETTAQRLGNDTTPEEIMAMVNCITSNESQIMTLQAQSTDKWDAKNRVNTLAEVLVENSMKILPTGNIQILDKAPTPISPIKPRIIFNTFVGFILGLFISTGIIFLINFLDNSIKTERDVLNILDIPVMGIIPASEIDK